MDVEHIMRVGYSLEQFYDPMATERFKLPRFVSGLMKRSEDGSCVFLSFDSRNNRYECSIYTLRPSVCRLYPFEFQKTGQGTGSLRLIPCCNGLNTRDGSLVDRGFIERHLLGAITDLL